MDVGGLRMWQGRKSNILIQRNSYFQNSQITICFTVFVLSISQTPDFSDQFSFPWRFEKSGFLCLYLQISACVSLLYM